jgi:diketogulonate reductase-like aldo/keto reductase
MPYDPDAPLDNQIHTSVASSLNNLRQHSESESDSYVDCLLLHSPLRTIDQTLQAWRVLESYVPDKIRTLGISNVSLPVLRNIHEHAKVKPAVVQNRFHAETRYEIPLRAFCREQGIIFQSFWTLTGNIHLLKSDVVAELAQAAKVGRPVALYALVIDQGVMVLNGTTSSDNMHADLEGIRKMREWAESHSEDFDSIRKRFQKLIEE